jgi:hypothetical protein
MTSGIDRRIPSIEAAGRAVEAVGSRAFERTLAACVGNPVLPPVEHLTAGETESLRGRARNPSHPDLRKSRTAFPRLLSQDKAMARSASVPVF